MRPAPAFTIGLHCLASLALCTACRTDAPRPDPASPQLVAEERRLLQPFREQRALLADRIEIEISPNFFDSVAQPAISPGMHRTDHVRADGADEYRFRNESGGVEVPLDFGIGNTNLIALRTAVLRVRNTPGAPMLRVLASGNIVESAGGKVTHPQQVRYDDGVLTRN
jgi:hypothetical protein